ncbi:MAG: nucleoside hydrolase [Pseudomonadota bacterium]
MLQVIRIFCVGVILAACTAIDQPSAPEPSGPPPIIILDTDFGGDADDLGAVAMLHYYMDRGDLDVAAIVSWSNEAYAVRGLAAVNQFYGRPGLRLGVRETAVTRTEWSYSKAIVDAFPFDQDAVDRTEPAVAIYRDILANAAPNSITIVTVGPLANIQNLLNSGPDVHSPLTGADLVAAKVDRFIIMGGQFPSGITAHGPEWNFSGNMPGVTKEVLETITRPIVFSGYEVGDAVRYGTALNERPVETPLYVGYKYYSEHAPWMKRWYEGEILNNASFDQTAVMAAVWGDDETFWTFSAPGTLSTDEAGIATWTEDPDGQHRYLILTEAIDATVAEIATAMTH